MTDRPTVQTLLEAYGWQYEAREGYIATGWTAADGRRYPLGIALDDRFANLTVVLLLDRLFLDAKAATGLLELNAVLSWAKIGLDPEGDTLTVGVDVPAAQMDLNVLTLAIACLSEAAELVISEFPGLADTPA